MVKYPRKSNLVTFCTTPELTAIPLAVYHLFVLPDKARSAILTHSPLALQVLRKSENASILAQAVGVACRFAEDSGWTLGCQWMPYHFHCNDKADAPAAAAHLHNAISLVGECFSEARKLIGDNDELTSSADLENFPSSFRPHLHVCGGFIFSSVQCLFREGVICFVLGFLRTTDLASRLWRRSGDP